jgi:hypothetical protein
MIANEFLLEALFDVGPAIDAGPTPLGFRRIIPITGGSFEGPKLRGRVVPGGEDRQIFRADGVLSVEARYMLETQEGVLITVTNKGLWYGTPEVGARLMQGEPVDPSLYYFRTAALFEAPTSSALAWLNRVIILGTASPRAGLVIIKFFTVN